MKNRSTAATVAISAVLVSVLLASVKVFSGEREKRGFGVSATTDKATYRTREPVVIEFKVFNHTAEEVVFRFRNAQRCDFLIEDEKGNPIWRWSEEMVFAQVLGEERVGPGQEEFACLATCEGLSPGKYAVMGMLIAQDSPISGSVPIVVK